MIKYLPPIQHFANGEISEASRSKSGTKQECLLWLLLFFIVPGIVANNIKQDKEIKV